MTICIDYKRGNLRLNNNKESEFHKDINRYEFRCKNNRQIGFLFETLRNAENPTYHLVNETFNK